MEFDNNYTKVNVCLCVCVLAHDQGPLKHAVRSLCLKESLHNDSNE